MLTIGTVYRMPSPQQENISVVDGLPNFYFESRTPDFGFVFQRGIHKVREVSTLKGNKRVPLIIISSTPRKSGSDDTPWHDRYDPDHGYVKYYGDNKDLSKKPEEAQGNSLLLDLLKYYESSDEEVRRENAVPIVFFEKCSFDGRAKGNAIFQGFGILESAKLVTQYDRRHRYFANYEFSFCILSLSENNEQFNWQWIIDRCDSTKENEETITHAPASWKRWLKEGSESLHLIRRSISGIGLVKTEEQVPTNECLLNQIYKYYENKKHEFEFLALDVTLRTIEESGSKCKPGWITKMSGDGGVDFVLRLDIGKEKLASVRIIVLGQAKCTDPSKPTSGRDIARTVARLRRGWIGAYVTTSYFSEAVQQEVHEDCYPLLLINGAKIASIVESELFEHKLELKEYLASLPQKYSYSQHLPEDILED